MEFGYSSLYDIVLHSLECCEEKQCDSCPYNKCPRGIRCRTNRIVDTVISDYELNEEEKQEKFSDAVVTLSHKDMYTMYAALATLKTSAAIMENINGCRTLSTIVKAAHDNIAAICKEEE